MKINKHRRINKPQKKKMAISKQKEGKVKKIIMNKKIRRNQKNKTNPHIILNLQCNPK